MEDKIEGLASKIAAVKDLIMPILTKQLNFFSGTVIDKWVLGDKVLV
jgi:hypothetical protein